MKRQMTPRERILGAIRHKEVDKLPTDYWGVPEITEKLFKHLGVSDMEGFAKALDMDKIMNIQPKLIGDRENMWDVKMKRIPILNGAGYYEETESFPLGDCETIEEIDACYQFPTTDMFDYSVIKEECDKYAGYYAIEAGYTSLTYFYEVIRGTEQMLVDMIAYPEVAEYVFHRLQEFSYAHMEKILQAGEGRITVAQVTDDFGTQSGLLFSPEMANSYLGDYYKKNVELVKKYDAYVFHHDDGAMTSMMPWLVDKGIELLNPLQWHLPGWDLEEMKTQYGNKICFHGGIDNQQVLPFGTPDDVRQEVRACAETLFKDKTGYILAPCHNVQAHNSIENVLAMYEEASKF